MDLYEICEYINDNTVVEIYAACTNERIALYNGKDSIPIRYMDERVTDISVHENRLRIEIDIEPDPDYMDD